MQNHTDSLEKRLTLLRAELAVLMKQPAGTPEQNFALDLKYYDLQTEISGLEDQQERDKTFQ